MFYLVLVSEHKNDNPDLTHEEGKDQVTPDGKSI